MLKIMKVCAGVFVVMSGLALADHGAPEPQLGGVTPCIQTSSVQLELEQVALPEADAEQLRRDLFEQLKQALQSAGVPFDELCPPSPTFVLLSVYARFLEPETYVGFPPSSYTYVTTGQVGQFSPQPVADTVLTPTVYAASSSEIFQAPTQSVLLTQLYDLGVQQIDDLIRTWLEANATPTRFYVLFAGFGMLLAGSRLLPRFIR